MRRLLIVMLAGLLVLAPSTLAATPQPGVISTITGQDLADTLGQWDGYDFQDAGDAWPGALRSGPSNSADTSDPYGADGTILMLPPLDDGAHPVIQVRLTSMGSPAIWDYYQRTMDTLGFDAAAQQRVYAGLGQVLGQAYAEADDQDHNHVVSVDVAPYTVLWQSRTSGFVADDPNQPVPPFATPNGGVTLEIVPPGQDAIVVPPPEPTPTPEPTPSPTPLKTPKPTPKATKKPTPTPNAGPTAPPPTSYVCDGTDTYIQDPLNKGWNIRRVDWGNHGKFDRLTVTLDQYSGLGGNGAQAIVHVLPVNKVQSTLKVSPPQMGDVAVALGLFQDVRLTWSLDRALSGLPKFEWLTMEKDNNGFPWLVLGINGSSACYSLQAPAWDTANPKAQKTIQVVVDVKH